MKIETVGNGSSSSNAKNKCYDVQTQNHNYWGKEIGKDLKIKKLALKGEGERRGSKPFQTPAKSLYENIHFLF